MCECDQQKTVLWDSEATEFESKLAIVGIRDSEWTTLLKCLCCGTYWEETLPHPGRQGGGPVDLIRVSKDYVMREWGSEEDLKPLYPNREQVKPLAPGDIFVLKHKESGYIFGRVIRAGSGEEWSDHILVYIYRAFSADKHMVPKLEKQELLIPPLFTFWELWLGGYFETVAHEELLPADVWTEHCFCDPVRGYYYDVDGKRISRFHAWRMRLSGVPCGEASLKIANDIDNRISDALGISASYN